jgi:hypothetical protein
MHTWTAPRYSHTSSVHLYLRTQRLLYVYTHTTTVCIHINLHSGTLLQQCRSALVTVSAKYLNIAGDVTEVALACVCAIVVILKLPEYIGKGEDQGHIFR